ncbi:MAG: Winged helix DNA-binding domain [Solirubrobacteraceae bacterium]|jgi:DNA-binding MarR family transcriptional regulator|nr:Winged helix DNA-binding domain [Solirubrobacteraceae bacterium]
MQGHRPAQIDAMVRSAAIARRLFPRGGFEGVDSTGLQVLLAVAAVGGSGCTVGDAADRLGLSPSTASAAIDPLRGRGLLSQATDPNDGRRAILHLTARGHALVDAFVTDRMVDPSVTELMWTADT